MRVVELPGVGDAVREATRPIPEPGPGEARVRVEACGVCGSDLFLQKGGFGADKLPVVPGHEAAGVVDAVGPGVTEVAVGDDVFGSMGKSYLGEGSLAELAVMSTATIARGTSFGCRCRSTMSLRSI